MGNSCITGAGRLNATSFPSEQTTFNWTIDGFSSLLDKGAGWTHSRVFKIMGMECYYSQLPYCKHTLWNLTHDSPQHTEEAVLTISCHEQAYPLDLFEEGSGIEFIKVATVKANTTSETLSVQKMNIFNEAKVHTWEIEDFYALKNPDYSPEFEVSGYTWFIRMRPSCDGNHLSIFLKMKRSNLLSRDSAKLVELTLSIKDQESDKHKKFSRPGRFQFSNNSRTWGWKKFITLEDFKDSSNGYLVKGKCCIEAEVAVVGSSKTK